MEHVNQLKNALKEEGMNISPPPELKSRVLNQLTAKKRWGMKKHVAALLIALFIIPTSAFAYQSILADGVYGSFEQLKKHVSTATIEGYMVFNAKLSQAKGELGDTEYEEFRQALNVLTDAKVKYGDRYGNINYDLIPSKEKEKIKEISFVLQPYFDKLNGDVSSKELLTPYEYELFIDALMAYETILAKAQFDTSEGSVTRKSLPSELQETFTIAKERMDYVYGLQQAKRDKN